MDEWVTWLSAPALLFALSVAGGIALELLVRRALQRWSRRTGRPGGAAVARSLRGLFVTLGVILGLELLALRLPLQPRVTQWVTEALKFTSIVVVTLVAARLAGDAVRMWMDRADTELPSSTIFVYVARGVVLSVGILVALGSVGVSITPMLTALGVGGLAVGLALQDTLGNLFSGIQILLSRQIEPGDVVKLESGEEGTVHDVTWRNTTVRLFTDDLVVVPNATLGTSVVTNYTSLDQRHVVWIETGVGYGSDLDHVEAVTREVAREVLRAVPGGVQDYEPIVRFMSFGDSSINLRVSLMGTEYAQRWPLTHEMIKRLHRTYRREGIEIPFPQRDVHVSGGVPADEPRAAPRPLGEGPERAAHGAT